MTEEQGSIKEGRPLLTNLKILEEALERSRYPENHAEAADPQPDMAQSSPAGGWFAASTLICACSLGLVSLGDALSRSGHRFGGIPFWLGLIIPVTVIAFRQVSPNVARSERIALAVLLGIFLYLVKFVRAPFVFDFGDEFNQAYNTTEVLHTKGLFAVNYLLPATPDYPGLASITAALVSLTHLSVFAAGLIVIAVARTIMILAVYLLLERATNSSKIAGLGSVVYMAAPNFLFFTAEVSYESLALPLAVAAMYVVITWSVAGTGRRAAWAVAALILIATVVPSHHMTSYVLIGALFGLSLAQLFIRPELKTSAFPFAIYALALASAWLVFVGSRTVGYLEPIFTDASRQIWSMVMHPAKGARAPYSPASSAAPVVPLWDRWAGLAAAVTIMVLIPFGVVRAWQRHGAFLSSRCSQLRHSPISELLHFASSPLPGRLQVGRRSFCFSASG